MGTAQMRAVLGDLETLERFCYDFASRAGKVKFYLSNLPLPPKTPSFFRDYKFFSPPEKSFPSVMEKVLNVWKFLLAEHLGFKRVKGRPSHRIAYYILYRPASNERMRLDEDAAKRAEMLHTFLPFAQAYYFIMFAENALLVVIHPVRADGKPLNFQPSALEAVKILFEDYIRTKET